MHVTGPVRFPTFHAAEYYAALHLALQFQLRMAARAWLRAVLTKVPSWTGQARGSLQPIGRFVAFVVPAPVSSTAPGDRSAVGQSQQAFSFTAVGGVYAMHWETSVPHYLLNEYYASSLPLVNPTPWASLPGGEAAFHAYLQANLAWGLPNPASFIY